MGLGTAFKHLKPTNLSAKELIRIHTSAEGAATNL